MKIACVSDIHGNISQEVFNALFNERPELIIIAGDITNFDGKQQAYAVLSTLSQICNKILAVPGNCDRKDVLDLLEETGISLHGRAIIGGEIAFFGAGGSPSTPFSTPFEISEEEIKSLLEKGYAQCANARVKVMVTHSPPYGILDRIFSGQHVGSKAIREFLEEKRDINYLICGHIHEASGVERFGNTLVINPGTFISGCYVLETKTGEVKRLP